MGFDCIKVWLEKSTQYNYLLIILAIASGILYCILKYLKKQTRLLDEKGR